MTPVSTLKVPSCIIFLMLILCSCSSNNTARIYEKTSLYDFNDTLINLDIAISEHNYRIIHRSNIGQAIRDRGNKDYPLSTVISFCNITYAQEMMEINSSLINDMPCVITVREQGKHVIVGTKLMTIDNTSPAQTKFAQKINHNLISIVEATIE